MTFILNRLTCSKCRLADVHHIKTDALLCRQRNPTTIPLYQSIKYIIKQKATIRIDQEHRFPYYNWLHIANNTSCKAYYTRHISIQNQRSRKMARFQVVILLSFLLASSNAFVTRPSMIVRTTEQSKLLAIDPSHLLDSASTLLADSDVIPGTSGEVTYSRASYYTILGLYLTSFPGLWSTIKRSTSAKVKRKTYVTPGEKASDGKGLRDQAGEIMACK